MTDFQDEDRLNVDLGPQSGRSPQYATSFPRVSVNGASKHAKARARAAWYNRSRGAGGVKLASERPAGSQRVIVKARVVVHANAAAKGKAAGSLMRHALYVEREGAGRDGDQVSVFDRELDRADGAAFVERCEGDRHHFRIIISPEFGADLESLQSYTRELMERVERDLGCRIDWIAAEHHDTGRPHVHLLIRGVRDDGRDLVIPREYISHTFRHRAEEIATRELGPRLEHSLSDQLDRSAERAARLERYTHLDGALIERARNHEICISDLPSEARQRAPLVQRLNRLEEFGLAERLAPDRWRLDRDLEDRLNRLADARDRERATARLLARDDNGLERHRLREFEQAHSGHRITGRVVGWEQLTPDIRGPYLIAIEGIDGKCWTARMAREEDLRALNGAERGAIVELKHGTPELRSADRTILEIARDDGTYSAAKHKELIPTDRDTYIQMHERRLEALRMDGIVTRTSDGVFHLPDNYAERVIARETRGWRESTKLEVLDPHSIEKQATYRGPTWLDRLKHDEIDRSQLRQEGFGAECGKAWSKRWEMVQDMGDHWRGQLRAEERANLLSKVEHDTGRVPHIAKNGDRVDGVFVGRIHTAEKSFALIVHERTATLAPCSNGVVHSMRSIYLGPPDQRGFAERGRTFWTALIGY